MMQEVKRRKPFSNNLRAKKLSNRMSMSGKLSNYGSGNLNPNVILVTETKQPQRLNSKYNNQT